MFLFSQMGNCSAVGGGEGRFFKRLLVYRVLKLIPRSTHRLLSPPALYSLGPGTVAAMVDMAWVHMNDLVAVAVLLFLGKCGCPYWASHSPQKFTVQGTSPVMIGKQLNLDSFLLPVPLLLRTTQSRLISDTHATV